MFLKNFHIPSLLAAQQKPGKIVGPIAAFLGIFFNAIFNMICGLTLNGSLGISIIIFTVLVKLLLTPLTVKQQKGMLKMQALTPKLKAIEAKYEGKTDTASQQRMQFELQELQRENGVSMASGCLPMLIQLPILYGLFFMFRQSHLYVDFIGANYNTIVDLLMQLPTQLRIDALTNAVLNHGMTVDVSQAGDLLNLVFQLGKNDIQGILSVLGSAGEALQPLFEQKLAFEYFLGINMMQNPGLSFPGILIPILAGASTYVSTKNTGATSKENEATQNTMKTMNIVMPIILGVMCFSMPAGLGIYWTISNILQLPQQKIVRRMLQNKEEK